MESNFIEIAKITKPFGIKGWMKAHFFIDDMSDLERVSCYYVRDRSALEGYSPLFLSSIEFMDSTTYARVRIENILDRNEAEKCRALILFVNRSDLVCPDKDRFFLRDLLDSECYYKGSLIGKVYNLINTAGQDMFVVKTTQDGMLKDLVVPFQEKYVSDIRLAEKKVFFENLEVFF